MYDIVIWKCNTKHLILFNRCDNCKRRDLGSRNHWLKEETNSVPFPIPHQNPQDRVHNEPLPVQRLVQMLSTNRSQNYGNTRAFQRWQMHHIDNPQVTSSPLLICLVANKTACPLLSCHPKQEEVKFREIEGMQKVPDFRVRTWDSIRHLTLWQQCYTFSTSNLLIRLVLVNLQLLWKCGKKTISDCFNKAGPKTAGTICLDTRYY